MAHSGYDNKRYFDIPEAKPIYSRFFASLDVSKWLDTENIDTVNFTAKERVAAETDVSTTILDQAKCTYNSPYLKPYIRAGEEGKRYRVVIKVTTVEASYEVFYIDFRIKTG